MKPRYLAASPTKLICKFLVFAAALNHWNFSSFHAEREGTAASALRATQPPFAKHTKSAAASASVQVATPNILLRQRLADLVDLDFVVMLNSKYLAPARNQHLINAAGTKILSRIINNDEK